MRGRVRAQKNPLKIKMVLLKTPAIPFRLHLTLNTLNYTLTIKSKIIIINLFLFSPFPHCLQTSFNFHSIFSFFCVFFLCLSNNVRPQSERRSVVVCLFGNEGNETREWIEVLFSLIYLPNFPAALKGVT